MAMSKFKLDHPLETWMVEWRKGEAAQISEKFPDMIPVIVERLKEVTFQTLPRGTASPYDNLFMVTAEEAIFVFVDNTLPSTAATLSVIYKKHKDEDGLPAGRTLSAPTNHPEYLL